METEVGRCHDRPRPDRCAWQWRCSSKEGDVSTQAGTHDGRAFSAGACRGGALSCRAAGIERPSAADRSLPATSSSENCVLSTPPCTRLLVGVHDGNPFPAKSPADGVILSFGLKTGVLSGANETVTFRLGRVGTITFGGAMGAGTGPTVTVHEPGTYLFPAAHLPGESGGSSGDRLQGFHEG